MKTTSSNLRGPLAGGGPGRRSVPVPRRSLVTGAVLFPLVVAGCGTKGSEPTGDEELLRDYGFIDADAHEIIDRLEALPVAK